MKEAKYRVSVRIIFPLCVILLIGLAIEGFSYLLFHYENEVKSFFATYGGKEWYKIRDPKNASNWVLKPGVQWTLEEVIELCNEYDQVSRAKQLKSRASALHIGPDEIILRHNQDGFKGPEIEKTHARLRILTIGDSCTQGSFFEKYSYPRVMEREMHDIGCDVEVVNAGVAGYSTRNVLLRIKEFKALWPEISTIYIGWNGLYSEEYFSGMRKYLYSLRLLGKVFNRIHRGMIDPEEYAVMQINKQRNPDKHAWEVKSLKGYSFSFIGYVERIVKEMQSVGSKVVLVTLPGLYTMESEPTNLALKGHLPTFTDNPFVLAKMTEQYNNALRNIANHYRLQVIDLERWSKNYLVPRDAYFYDSVHLTEKGQEMIGVYMARELLSLISEDEC